MEDIGYVYFLRSAEDETFKIGRTISLSSRVKQISAIKKLNLMDSYFIEVSDHKAIEAAYHRKFAFCCHKPQGCYRSEWFHLRAFDYCLAKTNIATIGHRDSDSNTDFLRGGVIVRFSSIAREFYDLQPPKAYFTLDRPDRTEYAFENGTHEFFTNMEKARRRKINKLATRRLAPQAGSIAVCG